MAFEHSSNGYIMHEEF